MPLISQADAMTALAPHAGALFGVASTPWEEYHARVPEDLLVAFCPRSRASCIHDLMLREAARYTVLAEGVRLFERNLMKGIIIDGRIAIRFKKLDEEGFSRGHYTKQVEEFRSQCQLDGIDAAHHLELGYVLNHNETEISEVRLVCPSGRGVAWWARLEDEGMQPAVFDLLPVDPAPHSGDGGAIITPKDAGVVVPIRRKTDEG